MEGEIVMKRKSIIVLCLIFVFLSLSACNVEDEKDKESFFMDFKGISQEEVYKMIGKPSNALHGARGDVYILENGTKITIYYDADGMINEVLITNKDDIKTFTTE